MRIRRPISVLVSVPLALGSLGAVAPPVVAGGPTTVHYPSLDCPSDAVHGLQACIDGLLADSTVIVDSTQSHETIKVVHGLTLRGGDRVHPPRLENLVVAVMSGAARITIQDLHIDRQVDVGLFGGAGHDVRLRRVAVGKDVPDQALGIELRVNVPASVAVEDSFARNRDTQTPAALNVTVEDPHGDVKVRVTGSRFTGRGSPSSGSGIKFVAFGNGDVRADFLANVIWDVGRCICANAFWIALESDIHVAANIVGNTIEQARLPSLALQNDLVGGHLSLDVFDNVFSHTPDGAITIASFDDDTLAFRAGHNAFYQAGSQHLDGESLGTDNIKGKDPKYVDRANGDFRLKSSSPLIDTGVVCSPGGQSITDAAGKHRLKESSVDIGAYERDAASASGAVRLGDGGSDTFDGTSGADILCGYGGKDTLRGKGGGDYVDGGSDNDTLVGGGGSDRLFGRAGKDTLCANDGVHGNDRADGGSGTDKAKTDSGDTRVSIEGSTSC